MKELLYIKGSTGQLRIFEHKIDIIRDCWRARAIGLGDKTIFIKDITGVELKKPGILSDGFFTLTIPGSAGNEIIGGKRGKTTDENSIAFAKNYNEFVKAKDLVTQLIEKASLDNQEVKVEPNQSSDDIPDQIKKLADLRDQGILTEEEFNSKKTDLLSKM